LSLGAALGLPPRRPGVLAVRLDDSGAALAALQRRLAAALCEHGLYEPEARAFLPHVTVARVRRGRCLRRDFLAAPPPPMTFSGGPVALYRSDPHPGGSRYETLGRWRSSTLVGGW
jgi:2'-5' RNA ligase